MHFVEVLEGRRQLRQHRPRVTQIHACHVVVFTKLSAMPLLCGLQTGVLMGFIMSSERASGLPIV